MSSTASPESAPEQDRPGPGTAPSRSAVQFTPWTIGLLISVAVLVIGSVLPLWPGGQNIWTLGGLFLLGVGVIAPLIAAGLQVARAAGTGHQAEGPRVGSLSTEQFTHVASWLAFAHFFLLSVSSLNPIALVGLVGAIGMLVCSPLRFLFEGGSRRDRASRTQDGTAAPALGASAPPAPETPEDIQASWHSAQSGWEPAGQSGWYTASGRQQVQDLAQPVQEVDASEETVQRTDLAAPADAEVEQRQPETAQAADPDEELGLTRLTGRTPEEAEAASAATFGTQAGGSAVVGNQEQGWGTEGELRTETAQEDVSTSAERAEQAETPRGAEPAQYEAFWFAVGSPRSAVGPDGTAVFALEPGGWILALEDRGHEFLVQNTDGRTGVLRDLQDIERA